MNPKAHSNLFFLIRPFVEFVSAPFWSVVSTRFRQAKNILLMAILSWIIFTVAIGFIKPPPHSCWREMNSTHQIIERVGYSTSTITPTVKIIVKRQTIKTKEILNNQNLFMNSTISTIKVSGSSSRRRKPIIKTTTLPQNLDKEDDDIESNEEDDPVTAKPVFRPQPDPMNVLSMNKPQKSMGNPLSITHTNLSLVKPLASPILYEKKDVRNVFMVFLLLIIVGEFFSAPAITLAVSKSLGSLEIKLNSLVILR
jgi:hypothetical protein